MQYCGTVDNQIKVIIKVFKPNVPLSGERVLLCDGSAVVQCCSSISAADRNRLEIGRPALSCDAVWTPYDIGERGLTAEPWTTPPTPLHDTLSAWPDCSVTGCSTHSV